MQHKRALRLRGLKPFFSPEEMQIVDKNVRNENEREGVCVRERDRERDWE